MSYHKHKSKIPSSYFDDDEDELFPSSAYKAPTYIPQKTERNISTLDRIAMSVIALCMAFWSLVIIGFSIMTGDWTIVTGITIGVLAYWGITWLMYYIAWKFYWIMIALGWMFATAYMLTIFGILQQTFLQLSRSGLYYR